MVTTNVFKLIFLTDLAKKITIHLAGAKPTATQSEIESAVADMIDAGVYESVNGELDSPIKARLIITEATEINVA